MPNPVSCHQAANDPSIIECDPVFIGPEPDPSPAAENRSSTPGVRALLRGHEQPLHVRREETIRVPLAIEPLRIATECAGETAGFVLGVIGATKIHPALGLLTAAKVGFDLGQCVAETVVDANQRAVEARALENCTDAGGTLGTVNSVLVCEIPPDHGE